jgi:hypothetical protein
MPPLHSGEGITGAKMEKACDEAHITLNKNAVVGDSSAMNPGGVRIGEYQARNAWVVLEDMLQATLHCTQPCAPAASVSYLLVGGMHRLTPAGALGRTINHGLSRVGRWTVCLCSLDVVHACM